MQENLGIARLDVAFSGTAAFDDHLNIKVHIEFLFRNYYYTVQVKWCVDLNRLKIGVEHCIYLEAEVFVLEVPLPVDVIHDEHAEAQHVVRLYRFVKAFQFLRNRLSFVQLCTFDYLILAENKVISYLFFLINFDAVLIGWFRLVNNIVIRSISQD